MTWYKPSTWFGGNTVLRDIKEGLREVLNQVSPILLEALKKLFKDGMLMAVDVLKHLLLDAMKEAKARGYRGKDARDFVLDTVKSDAGPELINKAVRLVGKDTGIEEIVNFGIEFLLPLIRN